MSIVLKKLKALRRKYTPWYRKDYKQFVKLSKSNNDFLISDNYPCINDKFESSGIGGGHYFHQDIYIAKEIYKAQPLKHVDVGSRVDGFIAHIAVFRKVEVFDIRPLNCNVENIAFKQVDLMVDNTQYVNYCDSISCLHTLEHFGLGRYGDDIDPLGHIKGFDNLARILKPNGKFYFSVPMGKNRIEFNAHRIFSLSYLLSWVNETFEVLKFSYIDDSGDIHEGIELNNEIIRNNCNCNHGCALFVLVKKCNNYNSFDIS
jgi:SAM-dependent methyltransferase